ncbi:MAG: prepilin-type N-terminal cleavage/methylation domain-containing protein [Candidatus Acidiferrales bacterium]
MRTRARKSLRMRRDSNAGFTLIETLIAVAVLAVGILSLAAMLATSLAYMSTSQNDYIAQEKATEAVESIFTARDMGQATWSTICNVGATTVCSSGIFVAGAMPLCGAGADGIIGTADDFHSTSCAGGALAQPDSIIMPGGTGAVNVTLAAAPGNSNGALIPLSIYNFKRTIAITNVLDGGGNVIPNLRQIQVTITYTAGQFKRQYVLTTNISNFS